MKEVNLYKSVFGRVIAFIMCFLMCFTFIPWMDNNGASAEAADSIKIGDYVLMGTYYGEPILWRCVAFYKVDKDGNIDLDDTSDTYKEGYLPLMLSDKILCLKAFDAGGNVRTGSHGRGYLEYGTKGWSRMLDGSNCWEDSNIRCWLNSTASAGNVNWTCGNPPDKTYIAGEQNEYKNESGFLSNFTKNELAYMKEVKQVELLDNYEYDNMNDYGSTFHEYSMDIEDCVKNFDSAYKKSIVDTVFLLDVKQVNEMYLNRSLLGNEYYIGRPTAKCVSNSEYKIETEKKWMYWLRTPFGSGERGSLVREIDADGNVFACMAYATAYGVRPAFYLNLPSTSFVSGDGSVTSPYTVEGGVNPGDNPGDNPGEDPDVKVQNAKPYPGEFSYYSGIEGVNSYTYNYDDKWLFRDSTGYNFDLLKMSIRVAMASFAKSDSNSEKNYKNIKKLMEDLEYDNLEFNYPKPERNSIGYSIGSKNIVNENGEKASVIMVSIRSQGYYNEWGGNVYVGPSKEHQGFYIAAETVKSGIEKYLNKYGEKLPFERKIWISGYSRGAATSNILACLLNEEPVGDYQFSKKNIFAFCFETPQGAVRETKNYTNIVNVVNPIDIVPKVAMSDWGFCRSGITYYLPSYYADGSNYDNYKKKMRAQYENLLSHNGVAAFKANQYTDEAPNLQYNEDSLLHNIAKNAGSRENYYYNYEALLCNKVESMMGDDFSVTDLMVAAISVLPVASTALVQTYIESALTFSSSMLMDVIMGNYKQPHYVELALSWVDSMDASVFKTRLDKIKYKKIFIDCPVDVTVKNLDGDILAEIIDDKYDKDTQQVAAFVDDDGQKVVIVPEDEDCNIELSATDDGEVSYIVSDYNGEAGENEHVVGYYDIPVDKGDTLSYSLDSSNESISDNSLYLNDNTLIEADVDQSGRSIQEWNVNVESEGSGFALGSGIKLNGEYTMFKAIPDEGAAFLGWYENGRLISKELSFRQAITKNTNLVAKFTEAGTCNFTDVNPSDYFYDPVMWAVNKGITKGTSDTTFSPNASCTRAQAVTFLWRAAGSPQAKSNRNPFTDVKRSDYYYDAVLWAVENNVTTGTSNTTFSPDATCSRGQIVTFLYRASGDSYRGTGNKFNDVKSSDYYAVPVAWAVNKGITTGTSDTTFSPESNCTRGQIVTFLYRNYQ